MIVIDPMKTKLAEKAKYWLQVKPGTDHSLALAFLHVIIEEELYDQAFVEKWTSGFDALKECVKAYTPETSIMYFVSEKNAKIDFEVFKDDLKYYETSFEASYKGYNDFKWNLMVHPLKDNDKPNTKELTYAEKGKYTLKFTAMGDTREVEFEIE